MRGKETYIVTAYRWGSRSEHSYISGVFSKKAQAIKDAKEEVQYRGGKYSCQVEQFIMDETGRDKTIKVIHTEKGMRCHGEI